MLLFYLNARKGGFTPSLNRSDLRGHIKSPSQMFHSKRCRMTKNVGQINTTKKDGSVSTELNDLPSELISEIFCRLPIESILRCLGVCKTWKYLIQDPLFINLQARKTHDRPSRVILKPIYGGVTDTTRHSIFLLDTEERKSRQIEHKSKQFSGFQIMSSYNGLLCMASDRVLGRVYVSNPMTGKFVRLPSQERSLSLLTHHVGLGFDSSNGRHIVVRVYTDKKKNQVNKFDAIMLGEKSWRTLKVPDIIAECTIYRSVFWNGALHWKIKKEGGRECMLSFDVCSQKFEVIRFPPIDDVPDDFEILELDGCLSLVQVHDTQMKLWRVKGDKIEELMVCYEDVYCMNVKWNISLYCEVIRGHIDEGYLLQVTTHNGPGGTWRRYLSQYFPKMDLFLPLNIPIPICFKTLAFRPTLISPRQRHIVPK